MAVVMKNWEPADGNCKASKPHSGIRQGKDLEVNYAPLVFLPALAMDNKPFLV